MSRTHPIQRVDREYRDLVRQALDRGFCLTTTRSGHPQLLAPDGHKFAVPCSGSGRGRLHYRLRAWVDAHAPEEKPKENPPRV